MKDTRQDSEHAVEQLDHPADYPQRNRYRQKDQQAGKEVSAQTIAPALFGLCRRLFCHAGILTLQDAIVDQTGFSDAHGQRKERAAFDRFDVLEGFTVAELEVLDLGERFALNFTTRAIEQSRGACDAAA